MKGMITKRDWRAVMGAFGVWVAIRLLLSRGDVALNVLMK